MTLYGRLRLLPVAGLAVVAGIGAVSLGVLFLSNEQALVAQIIEAATAVCCALSSAGGWLLKRMRRQDQAPTARLISGLPVTVPAGQLPLVLRGRGRVLKQLSELLRRPASGPAVLVGVGGAGKSAVAAAFGDAVQRPGLGRRRRFVWWVSASDLLSLTGGIISVARDLGASEADLEMIRAGRADAPDRLWALLRSSQRRWLLMLDNADDPSLLACPAGVQPGDGRGCVPADGTGWVRAARQGLVLVTTRDGDPAVWGRTARLLPLAPLNEADAAQVLLDCAPSSGTEAEARQLARRLGGLPLVLRLAGASMASDAALHRSCGEYLHGLDDRDQRPRLLTSKPVLGTPVSMRSVPLHTWEMSLDELARRSIPQARIVLRVLSCFAPAVPIPFGLLASPSFAHVLTRGGTSQPPGAVLHAEHVLEDALHGLQTLGLIDIPLLNGAGAHDRVIVVHPVIADTNRAHLSGPADAVGGAAVICDAAAGAIIDALAGFGGDRSAHWPDYLALAPHLHAVLNTAAPHISRPQLTNLVSSAMAAMHAHDSHGDYLAAERLASAIASAADLLGDNDPVRLRARHHFAWCTAAVGCLPESEAMFQDVHARACRVLGDDHPDALNARNEIAWTAACQQRWSNAEMVYREVLAARNRVLGPENPWTLITRHELAWTMANQGREQEAKPELLNVLAARKRLLGDNHWRTLLVQRDLAWIAAKQGRLAEAETSYRKLVNSCHTILGNNHPDTLTARHELAWVLALQGRQRTAARQWRDVLKIRTITLGETHPDTTTTKIALASLNNGTIATPHHIL